MLGKENYGTNIALAFINTVFRDVENLEMVTEIILKLIRFQISNSRIVIELAVHIVVCTKYLTV